MSTGDVIVEWLEHMHTLHCAVEMLYLVDGYEVSITWDGDAIYNFHAKTLKQALINAMEAVPDPLRR